MSEIKKLQHQLEVLFEDLEGYVQPILSGTQYLQDLKPGSDQEIPPVEVKGSPVETTSERKPPIKPEQQRLGWTWECDPLGYYTACSPEVHTLLGILPEKFIGQSLTTYRLSPQSSRKLEIILGTDASDWDVNLQFRTEKGKFLPVRMKISQRLGRGSGDRSYFGFSQILNKDEFSNTSRGQAHQLDLSTVSTSIQGLDTQTASDYSISSPLHLVIDPEIQDYSTDRETEDIPLLNRVTSRVAEALDLNACLGIVISELGNALNVHTAIALRFTPDGIQQVIAGEYSKEEDVFPAVGTVFPINWISEAIAETQENLVIQAGQTDPKTHAIYQLMQSQGVTSRAIFPLITQNQVIGTISMDINGIGRIFSDTDIHLIETVISQALITFYKTHPHQ